MRTYMYMSCKLYILPLSLTVADPHTRFGLSGGHICERRLARDACTDIRHETIALSSLLISSLAVTASP